MEKARVVIVSLMLAASALDALSGVVVRISMLNSRPAAERPLPADLLASSAPR